MSTFFTALRSFAKRNPRDSWEVHEPVQGGAKRAATIGSLRALSFVEVPPRSYRTASRVTLIDAPRAPVLIPCIIGWAVPTLNVIKNRIVSATRPGSERIANLFYGS